MSMKNVENVTRRARLAVIEVRDATARERPAALRRAKVALLEAEGALRSERVFSRFVSETRATFGGNLLPAVRAIVLQRQGFDVLEVGSARRRPPERRGAW